MKHLKALVIKDLQANRKALLIPVWYLLIQFVILAASIIYASSTGAENVSILGLPYEWLQNANLHRFLSFAIQIAMFFSFLGFIVTMSLIITSSTMLNQDIKHSCELFHRSQPVSVWKITGSRFIAGIGGPIILAFIIGFLNMVISMVIALIFTPLQVNLWMSINGLLLSWLHFSVALLVIGSILFVFSAIFKENAFGLGASGLGVLHILAFILNKIYGWNIPLILTEIYKFIMSGIFKVLNSIPTPQQFGVVSINFGDKGPDLSNFVIPTNFLPDLWSTLFTWDMGFKIVFCGIMYLLATLLYQRREVQF